MARSIHSGLRIARDPNRLDEVFKLFDAGSKLLEGSESAKRILASLKRDAPGVSAFRDRPRLDVDLVQLRSLPVGTLGYEFAAHMDRLGLDPAALPKLEAGAEIDDAQVIPVRIERADFVENALARHEVPSLDHCC
jgi:ubiquinone biosynthesis protein Coq4